MKSLMKIAAVVALFALVMLIGRVAAPRGASLSLIPRAHAQQVGGCTLDSLRGPYAVRMEGTAFGGAFAAVGVQNFDGNGNWVGNEVTASLGGISPSLPINGTYTINSDCSGTMIANFPGFTGHLAFQSADNRKELLGIETDPGAVISGRFVRQ